MDRSSSFLTETAAMQTMSLSSGQGDWSFKIGLSFVLLFAIAEMLGAGYHFIGRPYFARAAAAQTKVATTTALPSPSLAPPVSRPAPTAAAAPVSTPTISAADRLLAEAKTLREKGDTTNALYRLQEAAQREPKNAGVLAEMATIYESIQLFDRSNETWRKVQEIGPSAGTVYELAELKLKRGVTATPAPAPAVAETTPAEAASPRANTDGIPEGATFGISEVNTTETPDTDADTNLMLRIGVKKRPTLVVDHTKVKIQVFFYDTVDDKDIKLTDAEVNYEWLTPNHDWAQSNPEVLAVTYVRPKNKAMTRESELAAAAAAIAPGRKAKPKPVNPEEVGHRKYLGYIVRVYYNEKLQAVRADPTKLLNLFPAPSTASSP